MSYEITSPAIIHCGAGAFSKITDEAVQLGKCAAIITGKHLHGSEQITNLIEQLEMRSIRAMQAEPIKAEPTVEMVDELAAYIRANEVDLVISIGGGSVIDTAKAAAAMAANNGLTEDYQLKRHEIINPPIPQIAVPTTAGTGSEATRVSVLTNNNLAIKRSISHVLMTPNVVILDPELTVSLPTDLTTLTAIDAFAHAIESAVSLKADSYTRHTALAAIERLSEGLPKCLAQPTDISARLACLLGSCFAGLAMQNGLGASHSLAPAVCIVGNIRHSEAIAALLPHVVELNELAHPGVYKEVKQAMDCENVSIRLKELCAVGDISTNLSNYGFKTSDENEVIEVLNHYGSHRLTNPVEVSDAYARELFVKSIMT